MSPLPRGWLGALAAWIACAACSPGEGGEASAPPPPDSEGAPFTASNAFWYYEDLEAATDFYTRTLGLRVAADYGFAKILRIAETSYLTLVDEARGMHSAEEPKTVALALVTDQLDAWWTHLEGAGVEISHAYDPELGSAHDGFVAVDPEGYLLEFERFNPHPENERFLPLLDAAPTLSASPQPAPAASAELGFKATVLWLYYRDLDRMQRFWEDAIGLGMVADQGWTRIYRTSPTGFLGLVDETRGMHSFTEEKAVTVSLWTDRLDAWFAHARAGAFELRSDSIEAGDARYRAFVGYDPEGYFLEFDRFLPHPDNEELPTVPEP
ncbi:MAG: VOC family protein [Gemmatimonadota bacterium]|nr:VOC family protein [Gemmatimonadota bacterium]